MKTSLYKSIAFLFLLITVTASSAQEDKYNKKFHEQYPVDKSCNFEIRNKYGKINIENTTSDQITIDAEIVVDAKSQEKAEKVFKEITITISKEGNNIKAITEIGDINNAEFEINYTVLMPSYLNLNLTNKYGNVSIDELTGKNTITVKYGSLKANRIMDDNTKPLTTIDLGYSDNSRITEFNWGNLIMKYSDIEIEKGKAMVISSKYSKLKIGTFSSVVAESAYDEYDINEMINFVINTKYTDIDVEKVSKKVNIEIEYGEVKINDISDGFESVEVNGKYTDINLGFSPTASYKLKATAKYADIDYPELKNKERIKDDFSQEVSGIAGDEEKAGTVIVHSEYGDIDLTK